MRLEKTKTCQNCSATFSCYSSACWCNDLPRIMPLDPTRDCYCSVCLKKEVTAKVDEYMNNLTPENRKIIRGLGEVKNTVNGIDYYLTEDGYTVFTSWYHLRRGKCCKNDCRHCPYNKESL